MRAIYKWTNKINNKVYIGKSVNLAKRLREYRYEIKRGNDRPIIRALKKYGFENFDFEIIENCDTLTDEELIAREQYWIDYYDAQNTEKGYNLLRAEETPLDYTFGSNNIKARLNEEKVLNIREMIFLQNISPANVYKMYADEISYDAFCKAYRGQTWQNVDTSMIRDISTEVVRKGQKKAKLTADDVKEIRRLAEKEHKTISDIYTLYLGKCTRGTIKRVVQYQTWKNI